MNSRLRKDILTETYKDMQKLIAKAAWNFWNVYGGDIDDLMAQANLIFIEAFDDYDPSRSSKLTTWLTHKIRWGLLDYMRCRNIYEPHIPIDDEFVETYSASNDGFSVMELLDEMEQDAHIVLQLFLEIPKEVMLDVLDSKQRVDHVRACMRNRLKNRLRQMGWTVKRIKTTFEEIKEATSY